MLFLLAFLLLFPCLHADPTPPQPLPWLTGPLLTPSAHVIPNGHYNIEPYEFVTTNFGVYNPNWDAQHTPKMYNVISQIPFQFGMPANFDFTFTPQWSWNHTNGASHWALNDMGFGFDYQIFARKPGDFFPSVKLALRGNLPLGKYQKLNPHAKRTDVGGTGSWLPGAGIVLSRLVHIKDFIFLSMRANLQYTIPTPVHVKQFNAYGGGHPTQGKVFPGQTLLGLFGFELSLSQNWALAGDVQYQHINKTRFKGHAGKTRGIPNKVGGPSSESLSLAPAVEYNWSSNYGVIAGAWFSVAGRNAAEFASGVVALNIYH